MASLNQVNLCGRLGADPEQKYTQSGMTISNFSVATDESKKSGDGTYERHTEWHRVVAFAKTAEVANEYLFKGSQVLLVGKLRTRQWTDRNGNKRSTTEIFCDRIVLLDHKEQRGAAGQAQAPASGAQMEEDDIPY